MFPIFLWVKKYKSLENFSIILDEDYDVDLKVENLEINRVKPKKGFKHLGTLGYTTKKIFGFCLKELKIKKINRNNSKDRFYGENIDSVKAIVGKNGTGKTSILELLSKFTETNKTLYKDQLEDVSFLIIYKTGEFDNGKENFILEGYTNYYKDEYFKFLKNVPEKTNFINYFSFKMNIDNEYLYCLNKSQFGVISLRLNEQIDAREIKYIQNVNETKSNHIYKLNLNYKQVAKNKVYEYIRLNSLNEKNQNYLSFKFVIKIFERDYYFSLIKEKYSELNEYIMNDNIYLSKNEKEKSIKNLILGQCYNNLFQYEIYKEIKKLNTLDEIENIINSKYSFYTEKISKDELFDKLLENINDIEDIDLLKSKIIKLCNYLKKLEDKKIISKVSKFNFEINLNNILSNDSEESIRDFLNFYDQEITYEWSNSLSTDEIRSILSVSESGMSEGEKIRLNQFTSCSRALDGEFSEKKYITLLLDEAESFLHPEWCRTLLNDYLEELKKHKNNKEFKLIFATHSPFILGDILSSDIYSLDLENKKTIIKKENLKSFGGNIHNLLKENMFMESTFGKFAETKIKKFIEDITDKNKTYQELVELSQNILLQEIGEPLIRKRLNIMIDEELKRRKDAEYYEYKILEYKAKIAEYENELAIIKNKNFEN